ncbi:MAG: tetratricopeptide repeat protein [Candidatus Obscuribacterales bacterium]|nr:tetratricopeptide repeat protein [Candidatus Obscuribacterales bacterium]
MMRSLALSFIISFGALAAAGAAEPSLNVVLHKISRLSGDNKLPEARRLLDAYLAIHPNDPEALAQRGFLDNPDNFKSCKRYLTRALAVTKGGAGIGEIQQVYIVRAYANSVLGLKEEALADIEKARQIAPGNPEVYHIRGGIKERFKMHAEAFADLEKAATGNPHNRSCLEQVIYVAALLHKQDKQLKWLNKVVELFPSFETYRDRSSFCTAIGNYKLAASDAVKSLELRPEDIKAYDFAFSAVLRSGDDRGAERILERARARFPKDKGFRVSEAGLKLRQKKSDKALALYNELATEYQDDPFLHEQIGIILRDKQRYEEALDHFRVAAKFRQPVDIALHKRAESYRMAEQYAEAARDFTVMYSKSSNRIFIVDAGDCWMHNGKYKRALSTFEIALNNGQAKPLTGFELAKVYADQALCHLRLGDAEKSRVLATKALTTKPDFMDAILVRSQANTQLKRLDEAIADLTLAIKLRPDFGVPLEERAKLYDLKNQPELARQDRQRLANYSRSVESDLVNKNEDR